MMLAISIGYAVSSMEGTGTDLVQSLVRQSLLQVVEAWDLDAVALATVTIDGHDDLVLT